MEKKGAFTEAMEIFLEGLSTGTLIAAFLMGSIGLLLSWLLSTTKRDPLSERTPTQFSWKFFWGDNAVRIYKSIATTIIVLFLSFRFAQDAFGQKFSMFYCLVVGLAMDKVVLIWRSIKEGGFKSKP